VSGTASIGLGQPQATLVYAFDASGSTGLSGGACGTVLACEKTFFTGLNTAAAGSGSVNNIGLVASAGGLWLQTGGGHSDHVGFLAGPDLRPTDTGTDLEIGGRPITVTVANGGVWLAAPNSIACADPVSGRVRAHTSVPPRGGSTAGILDIEYARGQLFGYYRAGGSGFLVRLSPPPQCTP